MYDPVPFLLAQADAKPAVPAAPAEAVPAVKAAPKAVIEVAKPEQQAQGPGFWDTLTAYSPILIGVVAVYLFMLRQPRGEKVRDEMLKNLKKNDRVLTIGGIIGTVANITPDGKEVTLKIDDNARMHVIRTAIQTVLTDTKASGETKAS